MTVPLLASGSMLASRWIVGSLLGQTETARVYEAEEASQRRFAALKVFDPAFGAEPAWGEHVALTRALSELPGDGIARAYDMGVEAELGRPYVASERVTFPTLARYVAERGPVPLRVLAQALMTIASALDAAHGAGIVHGGLKPQNVFISYDNPRWARVSDFSLGRLRAAVGRGPTALLGWSAPEAAAGFASPAGDRYALGLLCFFAATGVPWYNALRPVDGPPSDRRTRVASARAKAQGGELDALFDPWFARALAADPSARFSTTSEMANAFVDVFTGAPTAELAARPSAHPLSETIPIPHSQVPRAAAQDSSDPFAATAPAAAERQEGLPHAARASAAPPASVSPPPVATGNLSSPPVPMTSTLPPRWLWLCAGGFVLLAVVGLFWLSRR